MRSWILGALFLFVINSLLCAQSQPLSIPVWQGFSQYWGYNHRINRLGDWLEYQNSDSGQALQAKHFAASGSGSDEAVIRQYYSTIQAPKSAFEMGYVDFEIEAKEGESVVAQRGVSANFTKQFAASAHAEMILAGFDLVTAGDAKADKLQAFSIQIDEVAHLAESGEVQARVSVSLRMACGSAECQSFNQEVKYRLRVYWTAILGEGFSSKTRLLETAQAWEKKAIQPDSEPERLALAGDAAYPKLTAGIKKLAVTLDDEQHLLGWESWVHPLSDFKNLLWIEMNMRFVQQQPSMYAAFKRNYTGWPKPPAKWVVKRKSGTAKWEMLLCMLMFEDATIENHTKSDTITWKTSHGHQEKAF